VEGGMKQPHYYYDKSTGIATGMLITAIHEAGLCTLTHTPTPMGFLTHILNRPENEKPFLLLPVGYPGDLCYVPNIERKSLGDVSVWFE
jgi:iodotyrosine deiodinase